MNLNLDQHIIDALDEMARRERRSRSMMANLILEQALAAAIVIRPDGTRDLVRVEDDPPRAEF